jgi:hypothetical protein
MPVKPNFAAFFGLSRKRAAKVVSAQQEAIPTPPTPSLSAWEREKARAAAEGVPPDKPKLRTRAPSGDADDDPAEMTGDGPLAQARNRERARCAAIISHPRA